jgi:hypothetical protein
MTRKTPQQKKALQYQKDRRTGSLHGYVKSYPKRKARIKRISRHAANAVLRNVDIESSVNAVEITDEQALTRERLQHSIRSVPGAYAKAYPHTLEEWVKARIDRRVQSAGQRYFAKAYNSHVHRKSFKRYLQTQLSGRSLRSASVAILYKEILSPSTLEAERYHAKQRLWLRSFFQDEPALERRLTEWIEEMEREY